MHSEMTISLKDETTNQRERERRKIYPNPNKRTPKHIFIHPGADAKEGIMRKYPEDHTIPCGQVYELFWQKTIMTTIWD